MSATSKAAQSLTICDIKSIGPKSGAKYSPRLYRFLLRNRRIKFSVFTGPDGLRYIGARLSGDNGLVTGRSLWTILHGHYSLGLFMGSQSWVEEPDFWGRYLDIGVCLFRDHSSDYEGRFTLQSETLRTCNWCGAQHTLKRWEEVVQHSRWEAV